jgi:hypothetical protein
MMDSGGTDMFRSPTFGHDTHEKWDPKNVDYDESFFLDRRKEGRRSEPRHT